MNETKDAIAAARQATDLYLPQHEDAMSEYLRRTGRPVACRLEFRLTSLEELKKAAALVDELNQKLQQLAYQSEADPMLRVLVGRSFIEQCRLNLKVWTASRPKRAAVQRKPGRQRKQGGDNP